LREIDLTEKRSNKIQTVRDQHVVPKCYLERWCNSERKIYAYKLEGGYVSTPSPKSAATREHIYDTLDTLNPNDPENYQIFEKTFGRIENEIHEVFVPVLANARRLHSSILIPRELTRISEQIADRLIRLAVVQFLRDTRHRDRARLKWNDWLQQIWDKTIHLLFDADDQPEVCFESVNEDFLTEWLIEYLRDRLQTFSKALKNKTMVVGLNKTTKKLLTSDSPVHWTGFYIDASANWDGINSRSSRLVYPLAPDVCVIFYDTSFYIDQKPFHRYVRLLTHREVSEFNQFLTLESDKQIFSCDGDFSDTKFALAQKIISGNELPEYRSTQVPTDLLELIMFSGCISDYTKKEWKAVIQFENRTSPDKYQVIRQQLLEEFGKTINE
jgi:hypothetical protein